MQSTRVFIRKSAATLAVIGLLLPAATLAAPDLAAVKVSIENFGRISDTYYRGSQPVGDDYAELAALGIKTVIDLQEDFDEHDAGRSEEADVKRAGMNFVRIPMNTRVKPTDAQIAQFLAIASDPAQQPVYVHCKGGKHRTGVMTAIYRMVNDKWDSDKAYDEMKDFEFGSSFWHPEFKEFVYDYHDELTARGATTSAAVSTGGTQ